MSPCGVSEGYVDFSVKFLCRFSGFSLMETLECCGIFVDLTCGCVIGPRHEDIGFFTMLAKFAETKRIVGKYVGGAISNAVEAPNIARAKRYQAVDGGHMVLWLVVSDGMACGLRACGGCNAGVWKVAVSVDTHVCSCIVYTCNSWSAAISCFRVTIHFCV